MPRKTIEQRLEMIERRQDVVEMAICALVKQDVDAAEQEGRDDVGNEAQSCIAYGDYQLTQAERDGDLNPRRRRIIYLANGLLSLAALALAACAHSDLSDVASVALADEPSPAATNQAASQPGPPNRRGGQRLPLHYRNVNVHFAAVSTVEAERTCPQSGHPKLVCLADALNALLLPQARSQLQLPYTPADARKWSNFPPLGYRDRVGVTLGAFDDAQLGYVKALLIEASGIAANEGYDELEQILNADDFLLQETGELGFSSSNFHIAFLGVPAEAGTWELQFGGHHTAFANTYVDGRLAGATPSFRGVEPFVPFDMNGRVNDPMAQERAAFATLLTSLTTSQHARARLPQTFTDVVVGPQKDDNFPIEREGLGAIELSGSQRDALIAAIATYVGDVDPHDAALILARYTAEIDETFIAYSGNPEMDQINDYIRIDGPSVWIEFSMQPGRSIPGVHPHSVWRDRRSDYAGNR